VTRFRSSPAVLPGTAALVSLVVVVAVAAQLASRPSPDVAWILYATRALLHGARLGVDVVENSPPMIFGLGLPAAVGAEALRLPLWPAWVLAVTAVALASATATLRVAQRADLPVVTWPWAATLLATVLLLVPGGDFSQRDHLALILCLPYLAVVAGRAGGAAIWSGVAIAVGIVAGLGIGIKPHFVLVPLGSVALLWRSRRWRGAVLPEHLAIGFTGLAYLLVVAWLVPDYFSYAAEYGALYQRFLRLSPVELLLVGEGLVLPLAALGGYAALRRGLAIGLHPAADTLAMSTAAFLAAAMLQSKGWRYHFLPALSLGLLLIAVLMPGAGWRGRGVVARAWLLLSGVVGVVVLAGSGWGAIDRVADRRSPRHDADPSLTRLLPLVRAVPSGEAVAVLSTNIASGFPLVFDGGAKWAIRYPSLWPMAAFYASQVDRRALASPAPPSQRPELERRFAQSVVDDLTAARPALILVLMPAPGLEPATAVVDADRPPRAIGGEARRFDYLGYFLSVPGMADLIRGYWRLGTAGMYQVLWRSDLPSPDGRLVERAPPGGGDN